LTSVQVDLLPGLLAELDAVSPVHLLGDDLDLLVERQVDVVQELELGLALAGLDDSLGERDGTLTTTSPVVGWDGLVGAGRQGVVLDELELGGGVVTEQMWETSGKQVDKGVFGKHSRELVDGDNDLEAELFGVLNVLAQVGATLLEKLEVLFLVHVGERLSRGDGRTTTVHLQRSDGGNDDDGVGLEARLAALDVAELCERTGSIFRTRRHTRRAGNLDHSLSIPMSAPKPASVIT
jgi:hypothetical protein